MAGEWIKWVKGLARKPEVVQIAHRLGLSRHAAAGLLMEVWEWADDNADVDEKLSGSEPDTCPGSVRLGEQSSQLFDATFGVSGLADAMTAVGWISIRSGSLVFPNFARHNGKSAKARALDSARKRAVRSEGSDGVRKMSGSEPDKNRTRGEERREEGNPLAGHPPGEGGKADKPKKAKPPPKARPRNPLFDAIAEVTGLDATIKANGELIGVVSASLAKGEPPYTPDEVRQFAREFWTHCGYAAREKRRYPTPKEVERNICRVRGVPAGMTDVIYG